MKKIFLTGCTIALFCAGTIAQVQDTTSTNSNLRQGVQQTDENMNREGNELQKRTDQTGNDNTSVNDNMSSNTAAPQHEVEVLTDKEGPNNSVVYKYQDGLYYVDREKKELVKIEESQLKDAEHKAIIENKEQ